MTNNVLFKTSLIKGPQGDRGEAGEADSVPTNGILAFDGTTIPEGYEETEEPQVLADLVDAVDALEDTVVQNTSDISTLNTTVTTNTSDISALNSAVTDNTQDIATQTARIDQIANLPSGSTSGDAELQDIRVGADGTTYTSAGAAVRGQIDLIQDRLTQAGFYRNLCGMSYALYPCKIPANTVITMSTGNGSKLPKNVVLQFYDSTGTYINGKTFGQNTSERTVTVEFSDVTYLRWNEPEGLTPLMVNLGNQKKPYIPYMSDDLIVDIYSRNIEEIIKGTGLHQNLCGQEANIWYPCSVPKGTVITMSTSDGSTIPAANELNLIFYNNNREYLGQKAMHTFSTRQTTVDYDGVAWIRWSRVNSVPLMVNIGYRKEPYVEYGASNLINKYTLDLRAEKVNLSNYGLTQGGLDLGQDFDGDETYRANHYRTAYMDLEKDYVIVFKNRNYELKYALYSASAYVCDGDFGTLNTVNQWYSRAFNENTVYIPHKHGYRIRLAFGSSYFSELSANDIKANVEVYRLPAKPEPYKLENTKPYTYSGKCLDLDNHAFGLKKLFTSGAEPSGYSFQAFAICNNILFQIIGDDRCATYDMETGTKLYEFSMTAGHGASATFANVYESGEEYPYLYVSGSQNVNGFVYVYINRVTKDSATLVKTLKISEATCGLCGPVCAVDKANNVLWVVGCKANSQLDPTNNALVISSFDLNSLAANIDDTYTPATLSREEIPFIKVIQSVNYLNNNLYLLSAWHSSSTEADNGIIYVFNTISHKIETVMDFPNVIKTCEFEDIEFVLDPATNKYKMIGHGRENMLDYFEILV